MYTLYTALTKCSDMKPKGFIKIFFISENNYKEKVDKTKLTRSKTLMLMKENFLWKVY